MIKILVLTDRPMKWYYTLLDMMDFNLIYNLKDRIELGNKMFHFVIETSLKESRRGAAYAHVILDKEIDEETYHNIMMPTIKQRVTQHGLDKILNN